MDTKRVHMLLLVFPLSLMLCLIARVTNYTEAVVTGKGKRNAILTILTITNPIMWGLSQVIESRENKNFACAPFELQDFTPSLITLNGANGEPLAILIRIGAEECLDQRDDLPPFPRSVEACVRSLLCYF